ncbi:MAG: hypothetical protein QOG44_1930 [Acidimicrobiaceae bacterium]|nr:hypothetical protein [Acidimicrobiaceae bacterium]
MTRLVRTLTVILGVLIVLSGGAFALIRVQGDGRSRSATVTAGGANRTSTGTAAGTISPGPADIAGLADGGTVSPGSTTAPGSSTSGAPGTTAAAPATTAPLSPLANLTAQLDGALAGTTTCLSVEDGSGRVLYQHQPDAPLIPASTQKLLVAEAALATLGPNYRFTTSVVAPAAPVKGKVDALWLVGNGDPLLATPEFIASTVGRVRVAGYPWTSLSSLADTLVAAGVKSAPGGVKGDDSSQDRLRFLPVWPALYQQQSQIGLLSALSVNEGIQFTPPKSTLAQDPPGYAASELARLLQSHQLGIGSQPDQAAPAGTVVLATVSSAPLSQIVESMLRASDNWIAELLVRAIDKATGGTGTTAGGVRTVMRLAVQAGIPMSGAHMDDGSGLSRTDRATCRELLAALDAGSQAGNGPVIAGLAVAGQTGTLATRYKNTAIAGKLRAKTGSLDNAGGMVGIVTVAAPVRFAFLDNDTESETAILAREDAVVGALAGYTG